MKRTQIGLAAAVCGLVLTGAVTMHPQEAGAQGRRKAGRQTATKKQGEFAQLLSQLNLTPDQKKQVATIAAGAKQQRMSIMQNASLSAADKKTQEKALGKETRKQVVAILTPAQKKQLKQLIAQRRAAKTGTGTAATPGTPVVTPPATTAPKTGAATPTGNGTAATAGAKTEDDDELDGLDLFA